MQHACQQWPGQAIDASLHQGRASIVLLGGWVSDDKLCQALAEAAAEAGSAAAQEAALREAHAAAEGALRAEASQRPLLA